MSVRSDSRLASSTLFGDRQADRDERLGWRAGIWLVALLGASCGGPSVQPTPPPGSGQSPGVDPLRISCPADQATESPNGAAIVVEYPAPSTAGGMEPVALACHPQSGSPFAEGSTPVSCTAEDHEHRTAACNFAVKVGGPPQISCPEGQTVTSPDGLPVVIDYAPPTVVGGSEPMSVACTPDIGSPFKAGSTVTSCTVRDQAERTAQCSFTTTVHGGAELEVTKFVAFGDSITYGTQAPCGSSVAGDFLTWYEQDIPLLWATARATTAYPWVLGEKMTELYKPQSVTVINEGTPGERVTDGDTASRLSNVISHYDPDVLLLQEGANDVNDKSISIDAIASSLKGLVRVAKSRGVRYVLLGTLLPERAGSCRAFAPERVEPVNSRIKAIAGSERVELVDLYDAFVAEQSTLLGPDGLHPTVTGYERMADTFFETIRDHFEDRPKTTTLTQNISRR
jgi:lysophospholipase L1-like esterase